MAVTMSSDLTFTCDKCPRTFKLQEFYDKHKLVHDLKKQHVCHLCGSVYGAAKGLEGHLLQHHDQEREEKKPKGGKEDKKAKEEEEEDKSQREAEAPTPCDVTFLNSRGVLANANASGADGQADLAALEAAAKQANGTGSYDVFGKYIRDSLHAVSAVLQEDRDGSKVIIAFFSFFQMDFPWKRPIPARPFKTKAASSCATFAPGNFRASTV